MEYAASQIQLRGTLMNEPEFSHENHGKSFYRFLLEVPRLSGTSDILPIITESSHILQLNSPGTMLFITGQVRSHNIRSDGKRHLLVFVFATNIVCEDAEPLNDCIIEGYLCREPCILWGKTARQMSQCHTQDKICIIGRLQSRTYTKQTDFGAEKRTTYEISALSAQVILDSDSEL